MAKEKQRHCTYCGEDIRVRLGLFYSDSYCCNCGSTIRARQTLFGKQIYLTYPKSYIHDGTYLRMEVKGGKKNGKREMPEMR